MLKVGCSGKAPALALLGWAREPNAGSPGVELLFQSFVFHYKVLWRKPYSGLRSFPVPRPVSLMMLLTVIKQHFVGNPELYPEANNSGLQPTEQ
jgi:hypothetical protein